MSKKNNKPGVKNRLKSEVIKFRKEFSQKTLNLVTSGFGLVAALAWNELIKEVISTYIQPFFGGASGIISRIIYAVVITLLAVLITYNLSRFAEKKN